MKEKTNSENRKEILNQLAKKQAFKVSTGETYIINGKEVHAKWFYYNEYSPKWRLRQILDDEIVIEFDVDDKLTGWLATNETCINLYNKGYEFEIWEHNGRSPHIHIRDLPIKHLDKQKRAVFKKVFIRNYVPLKFLGWVDYSLTGNHLVRLEYSPCFKGKHKTKELVYKFNPKKEVLSCLTH